MSETIQMPKLGLTMESGKIIKWYKNEGDSVVKGDVLLEVESDKSTVEIESEYEGVLLKQYFPEGDDVECGLLVAAVGRPGETPPGQGKVSEEEKTADPVENSDAEEPTAMAAVSTRTDGRVVASPRARRYAKENKIDLLQIKSGSGSNNRIEERDVKAFFNENKKAISPLAAKIASQNNMDYSIISGSGTAGRIMKEDIYKTLEAMRSSELNISGALKPVVVPVTKMRETIAKRLEASKRDIPHFYLRVSTIMEELLKARAMYNKTRSGEKISLNAILMKIISVVLEKHPYVNSSWQDDGIYLYPNIDIALAVATETGLITPIVRNCQRKGISDINIELSDLIERARKGALKPDEYSNPTFTISNLGMYGIEDFAAIINPPASAILAVGSIEEKPVGINGDICLKPVTGLTLSGDHRVIDGAVGAEFMQELKRVIEFPFMGYF